MKKKRFIVLAIILVVIAGLVIRSRINATKNQTPTYQTAVAERGTLVSSISASGTISAGNSSNITTKASGTVQSVYVTNGDTVKKGQKIALLTLDDYGQERQTSAWAAYLDAQVAVKTAIKDRSGADIDMWKARQAIDDAQTDIDYKNNNTTNPTTKKDYTEAQKVIIDKSLNLAHMAFDEAELAYKNANASIADASAKVGSSFRDYQQVSAIITAPADGTVTNLALSPGVVIETTTSESGSSAGTTVSAQEIGKVESKTAQLQAKVNLTELDVIRVNANQKVTITLDAYPDKTFTGKVLAVNTTGITSSGVTSYPVIILLDPTEVKIYPNMAVAAQIILSVKTDVITVPTAAVKTTNGVATVDIMKNNTPTSVQVETGDSSDTQIEIVSGISEGDVVVTGTTITTAAQSTGTTSVFGGGNRGFGTFNAAGSGAVRINTNNAGGR